MKLFKKLKSYTIYTVLACVFTSCSYNEVKYPRYSLETIEYIPDTLKVKHRTWITETVRAASQHMTGGDYEDVYITIRQSKFTADELFEVSVVGLRKEIDENYFNDLHLKPEELNSYESNVLDSLVNEH